jgi:sugar transferase (PEP-CTERM/EpsH1 system associated)
MKILWAKIDFLHPTNRGGQIRTLEMLKRMHLRHEIHYVAYDDPDTPEGRERAGEYASKSFPVQRAIPSRGSLKFFLQLAVNLLSPLPLAVGRYRSREMRRAIGELVATHSYDAVVADFLSITPNFTDLSSCVLFQHNVESEIWRRHAEHASTRARRLYFSSQARRMERYERTACRAVQQVVSVSPADSETMRRRYGVTRVDDVPTGVDIDFFRRPECPPHHSDIVFVGAMDWLPNIDGARWFMDEVFPRIRARRPHATVTFAGRNPAPEIRALADAEGLVRVTGTVPDVRPYLWGATVSVVPLRIGGGTRLKIYEAMAAGVPVVSTPVGAEGLAVTNGKDIRLAADPDAFARYTLELIDDSAAGSRISESARMVVERQFSWESVARRLEAILEASHRR